MWGKVTFVNKTDFLSDVYRINKDFPLCYPSCPSWLKTLKD